MKASIGFRTNAVFRTAGGAVRTGGTYAQCLVIFASAVEADSGHAAP